VKLIGGRWIENRKSRRRCELELVKTEFYLSENDRKIAIVPQLGNRILIEHPIKMEEETKVSGIAVDKGLGDIGLFYNQMVSAFMAGPKYEYRY
jgi:hypothetical protein